MSVMFINCSDDTTTAVTGTPYDPNKPIVCESFIPDSGGVGTQLIIRGENFGIDTALVKVSVNGKNARVVGVNSSRIYAVVPTRADTGIVKVSIGKQGEEKNFEFENPFLYLFRQNVSTVVGQTKDDGSSQIKDGTLAEAWIQDAAGLCIDNENVIYLSEERHGIRKIDMAGDKVSILMSVSGNLHRTRDAALSMTGDTLFCVNDTEGNSKVSVFTLTRNNGFMNTKAYVDDNTQGNAAAVNPVDGELFYNSYGSGIYRYKKEAKEGEDKRHHYFRIDENTECAMTWSPDGKILYISTYGRHAIFKADYNFATKELSDPVQFVGNKGSWGYADGLGSDARFDQPAHMVCDEYGVLYVVDKNNHCIRQVTPDGMVSTFAGTPRTAGFADGEPSKALFRNPEGITLNREDVSGAFYVSDRGNHRIRKIMVE